MRYFLVLIAGAISCHAAIHSVCASGCAHSNLQSALNAAARGDIVELAAGETFEGVFTLPFKPGSRTITVRSSRWRELPPAGKRVTPADAALMPRLQPSSGNDPALRAGYFESSVLSVNTETDTITFTGSTGFVDGDPVACWHDDGTIPVIENRVYYARDTASNSTRLALVAGGQAVDLASTPTATRFRCTEARSIQGWIFQGIEISAKSGQLTQFNLIEIGTGQATARQGLPTNIHFEHSYIHGLPDQDGPNVCIYLNSAAFSLTDSYVAQCKRQGYESKAISIPEASGPLYFANNYLEAASINLLTGGDFIRIEGSVPGDTGGMTIVGNHFFKPLSYRWTHGTSGSDAPAGGCSDGARYMRTSNGQWYLCASSTWSEGPECADGEYFLVTGSADCDSDGCWTCEDGAFTITSVYRQFSYGVKNLFEIKSAVNVVVYGNIFENNWGDAQDGIAVWIVSQVESANSAPWARGENIRFENNIIRNSSSGIRIASENHFPPQALKNNRILMRNNLAYKIGVTDYPSINLSSSRPLSFGGPCDECVIDHNTIVSGTTGGQGIYFDTAPFTNPRLSNSILYANQYGLFADGGAPVSDYWGSGNVLNSIAVDNDNNFSPPSSFGGYATNGKYIATGTTLFVGGDNYRLNPASPYSASCVSSCDFAGTDGKDLGVDIDQMEASTDGVTKAGPTMAQMGIEVEAGSRHAIIRYNAPSSVACDLTVFTDPGRTAKHADTNTAEDWSDGRPGNLADGLYREFVVGTVAPLSPSTSYYGRLDCGSLRIPLAIRTTALLGEGTYSIHLSSSTSVRYADHPDFVDAIALPAATRHEIPVPSGGVVYVQVGSLPARAVAGR